MTEIIRQYVNRTYQYRGILCSGVRGSEVGSRLHEDARKQQTLNQYVDMDRSALFRKGGEYVGLRKLNNGNNKWNSGLLNCVLQALLHVDCVVETLLTVPPSNKLHEQLRDAIAKLQHSKFSYVDAYDLHLKLKAVASEFIGFAEMLQVITNKAADQKLRGLLSGQLVEYQDDMDTIEKNEVTFTSVTLQTKLRTFEAALEAFKSRKTSTGGVVSVQFSKLPALLSVSLERTPNSEDFFFPMSIALEGGSSATKQSHELEQLTTKIYRIEQLLEKQEFKQHNDNLTKTLAFLEAQEFVDVEDVGLGLADLSYNYGVLGNQEGHEQAKNRLKFYTERLSKHEQTLQQELQALLKKKAEVAKQQSAGRYTLLAVLLEDKQGNCSIAIYNQRERKWRRFQDRRITELAESELKKEGYSSAVGLIYRSLVTECTAPPVRPVTHEPSKQQVVLHDHTLSKRIDQLKVQRSLKSYSQLAHDEIEYYLATYQQNSMNFVEYFSTPLFQLLNQGNVKLAELQSFTNYLKEPSFAEEIQRLLQHSQPILMPEFAITTAKEYSHVTVIVKTALLLESTGKIVPAVQLLAQCYSTIPNKNAFLKSNCESMLALLLFKACFYLDLKAQSKKDQEIDVLINNIMFVVGMLPNGLDRQQITANIKNTLGTLGRRLADKYAADLTECNQLAQPDRKKIQQIQVSRLLAKRFKLWIEFMTDLHKTKALLNQQTRTQKEILLFPEHL